MMLAVGTKHLENILKHLNTSCLVPRENAKKRKKPHNALPYPAVENAVTFLKAFADRYGKPHPAPQRSRAGTPPIYLAATNSICSMHKQYCAACVEFDIQAVGYDSFRNIWSATVSHSVIASPRTDAGDTCEGTWRRVASAVSDTEKQTVAQELIDHTAEAQRERDFYAELTKKARKEIEDVELPVPPVVACSNSLSYPHYTFDFAQNIALPQSSRQEGPLFFKVPRKVQVFGVTCEGLPCQVNYMIDEAVV
eukprot:scpid69722/ scgid11396/ 